jgi:hypothetical protein
MGDKRSAVRRRLSSPFKAFLWVGAFFVVVNYWGPLDLSVVSTQLGVKENEHESEQNILKEKDSAMVLRMPEKCTQEQLDIIERQLPAVCSLQYATSCPQATWLESYFRQTSLTERDVASSRPPIAIHVGCNKGFDALNSLQMLSNDKQFDKERWKQTFYMGQRPAKGVCGQENAPQYVALDGASVRQDAVVHCIEALPSTAAKLKETTQALGWSNSLVVTHAAISSSDGTAYFPVNLTTARVGVEQLGLSDCSKEEFSQQSLFRLVMSTFSLLTWKGKRNGDSLV